MKYIVLNQESGISVQIHSSKKDAENQATKMADYHSQKFIVKEVK